MNIKKLNHIGVAVKSIDEALPFYKDILGLKYEGDEVVEEQKVRVAFLAVGESRFELLESTDSEGAIAKYIEKKGTGIQHIAIEVDNIEQALKELEEKGIAVIDKTPRKGAHDNLIAFLHPKSTGGVLVEICQAKH